MNLDDVSFRLQQRFGLGGRPDLRKRLYDQLQELVLRVGEPAYVIIASAAADAQGKDNPGRYFARVVSLRLKERGITPIEDF